MESQLLERLSKDLFSGDRYQIKLTRDWVNNFPNVAGAYIIFENAKVIYVGETGSLQSRMRDLLNTKNHCFRRSLGARLFSQMDDYTIASSFKSYNARLESLLNAFITQNLSICYLEVKLGRKELEEHIINISDINILLNKRNKRAV